MNDAIGKRKRGVWIGVYVLVEVFAFAAYLYLWIKRQPVENRTIQDVSGLIKAGANTFRRICDYAAELGIECVTFYAFSTENWKRPAQEVASIMDLFRDYLDEANEREDENEQKGMRIRYIGERPRISSA